LVWLEAVDEPWLSPPCTLEGSKNIVKKASQNKMKTVRYPNVWPSRNAKALRPYKKLLDINLTKFDSGAWCPSSLKQAVLTSRNSETRSSPFLSIKPEQDEF
jgi:hypothetical protein